MLYLMQRVTDTSKAVGITKCGSLHSADSKSVPFEYYLPHDTMHRADYAVSSLSISLSHASILLKWQNIIQLFSPSGSHTILVIPYQSVW